MCGCFVHGADGFAVDGHAELLVCPVEAVAKPVQDFIEGIGGVVEAQPEAGPFADVLLKLRSGEAPVLVVFQGEPGAPAQKRVSSQSPGSVLEKPVELPKTLQNGLHRRSPGHVAGIDGRIAAEGSALRFLHDSPCRGVFAGPANDLSFFHVCSRDAGPASGPQLLVSLSVLSWVHGFHLLSFSRFHDRQDTVLLPVVSGMVEQLLEFREGLPNT